MRKIILAVSTTALLTCSLIILSGCSDSDPPSGAAATDTEVAGRVTRPDAYAPMLMIPKKLPDDPGAAIIVMMANNSDVPSVSEVNVVLYPGARVMSTMAAMEMTANDVKITSLPSMAMMSSDETSEVVAFYREQLAGWQYKEFFGTHSFWNGGADSDPLDITGQFSLVVVVPLSEDTTERAMWPEVRTRIDIRYQPVAP